MIDLPLNPPTLAADLGHVLQRLAGAAHYGLVLLVWAGLLVVSPALAIRAFRNRRLNSPIPRRSNRRPY